MDEGQRSPRVLVVDDSRAMRITLARLLGGLGMEVTEAGNGVEALEALATGAPFDAAFIDWYMPGLNGLDLVRQVRAEPAFDPVRLVMVTSECEAPLIASALDAGADEYVTKPFDRVVFESKLAEMGIERRGQVPRP
ncbi:MAG: response regulator [Acidimicrobiales bacterium]